MSLREEIHDMALRARVASERMSELSAGQKDAWLLRAAERLEAAAERIRTENARDLRAAEQKQKLQQEPVQTGS